MTDDEKRTNGHIDRRRVLGALGGIGAAGALGGGTSALLWDEEIFGSMEAPNVLQAGELDLKVDYEVYYYDDRDATPEQIASSDTDGDGTPDPVDNPGPLVDLTDVKPGDIVEHTLSYHVYDNPAYVSMAGAITADAENGMTDPEAAVDDTEGGELDDHLRAVVWYDGDDDGDDSTDAGNNFPDEITDYDATERGAFQDDLVRGDVSFDTESDAFVFEGTVRELFDLLSDEPRLSPGDDVAGPYPGTNCFRPSTTHYLGVLFWLPRDIPGVNDNVVQSDRLEYNFGFHAEQCRHNATDTPGHECPECSFTPGPTDDSVTNLLSVGPDPTTGYPDIDARIRVDTTTGNAGDLTASDFSVCEDGCGQTLDTVAYESGGTVDIVVVFDDTGSMGDEIDTMKSEVNSLTDDLEAAGIDARYALLSFKDSVEIDSDFTDAATFQSAVDGLSASGGGDTPEDNVDALAVGTGNAPTEGGDSLSSFRTGAQRVIIDITDVGAYDSTTDSRARFTQAEIEGFLDDGNFSYYAVAPSSVTSKVSKREIANNVDDGTWEDINTADFDVILNDIVGEITDPAYVLSYTTTNPATDGSTRTVDVEVDDPDEGLLYEEGTYTAPSS